MSYFEITGGIPLHGEVRCSGAKNAALPIMAASILASEPVRLDNVPRVSDVRTQARVLRQLGIEIGPHDDGMELQTVDPTPVRAPQRFVRRMRASFCVLGPLLARRGTAIVPLPGGCNIGHRPVDLHLKGLAALGASLQLEHGYVVATARRLTGAAIDLSGPHGPTVTGTANVMCAAALARGDTTIRQAALEPEIIDLGNFLIALGARIEGLGTPTIHIRGVDQLGGATHRLIPDRIEAATLLLAGAITGGSVTVDGVIPEHLSAVLAKLDAAGATIDVRGDRVSIRAVGQLRTARERSLRAADIVAEPYPGVPTDIQAQWTVLMAVANGGSRIEDRVFPGRSLHVAELNRMGANIVCRNGTFVVTGTARLESARVIAGDLRASAALVLAGLAAEGRTIVDHIHHLDRGYQRLDDKLRGLGAKIDRLPDDYCDNLAPASLLRLTPASAASRASRR